MHDGPASDAPALSATPEGADPDQRALTLDDAALPVVDLGPLVAGEPDGVAKVAAALGEAARSSGFFYVANHGVPQDLVEAVLAASQDFHGRARAFKMRWWSGFTTHHRGYVPFEENGADFPKKINFNEAWDMGFEAPADHPDHVAGWRMTGPNVWPDIPGWRETVSAYYEAVFALSLKMMDCLAWELGVDAEELRAKVTCPTSQLRLLRYVPNDMPATRDVVGIASHSDFECFTILLTGSAGLQVMNADDMWIEAPPIPGCFVVNIGDIFEAWSGGRYKSTQHRVVNIGRERFSCPLFFGLNYHEVVQPLEKFRTPEAMEKYPPFKAGDHLMRMTVPSFRYMDEAYRKGDMRLDFEVPDSNPFKREAKTPPPEGEAG
ncbi:Isopenicillin N synthase [Albimonas donghaensis]|uniref:2-oxoglutarate-dependent ethylene/succinate-forming enzyme n=1 Tax=Albimonas donghaensis TaxID=356660 RepID=A0A1H2WDA3_9RHOB|nr:2-oxoglutarate and iron-dependent oxygenase domain-containing protein [Albimonas donghaensis]SDW78570.1 Isopenicillin N synthase [Albimonas donghaensis]